MIFHVYGHANPTQGLFQYLKGSGHTVHLLGKASKDGRHSVYQAIHSSNVIKNLSKPGYHFFTRLEGCPEDVNAVLEKTKSRGKRIAHISYGWKGFNDIKRRLNFNNFDYVFCCNSIYAQILRNMGITAYFLPNTIDPHKIKFIGYEQESDYNLLAYSLRFSPAKNYPALIKFFHQLLSRNDKLHLTIRAAESNIKICRVQERKVRELIKKFGIEDKVSLLTYPLKTSKKWRKSYGDANLLLQNNAMCISYSRWESFGYTIAEAMLAGKQVFVKGWGTPLSPYQFWGDAVCESKEHMMEKVLDYADCSQEKKEQVAKENRQFVEQLYAPKVAGELLLGILEDTI